MKFLKLQKKKAGPGMIRSWGNSIESIHVILMGHARDMPVRVFSAIFTVKTPKTSN